MAALWKAREVTVSAINSHWRTAALWHLNAIACRSSKLNDAQVGMLRGVLREYIGKTYLAAPDAGVEWARW